MRAAYYRIDLTGKRIEKDKTSIEFRHENNKRRWAKAAEAKKNEETGKYEGDIWNADGSIKIAKSSDLEISPFVEGLAVCKVPEKLLSAFANNNSTPTKCFNHTKTESETPGDRQFNTTGFIDKHGRMVIEPQFYRANNFTNGFAKVERWRQARQPNATQEGYINKSGDLLADRFFETLWDIENGFAAAAQSDPQTKETSWGFVCTNGTAITARYSRVKQFSQGLAAVQFKDNLWGYIDEKGARPFTQCFTTAGSFAEGMACVKVGDKYGFIDKTCKFVIPPTLLDADAFSNGLAPAAVAIPDNQKRMTLVLLGEHHCGFINPLGQECIRAKYAGARPFSEGLAAVRDGLKWGYINIQGKMIIKPAFDDAHPFAEGLAAVLQNNKWGYINKRGQYTIKPRFSEDNGPLGTRLESPTKFSEGVALAADDRETFHFINRQGDITLPNVKIAAGSKPGASLFSNGLACLQDQDSYLSGYINHAGQQIIAARFSDAKPFFEGLASVEVDPNRLPTVQVDPMRFNSLPRTDMNRQKYGFIDKKGTFIISPQFDQTGYFSEGLAPVAQGRENVIDLQKDGNIVVPQSWTYIDKSGRIKIPTSFRAAHSFSQGRAAVEINSMWGFVDHSGNVVIKPIFDSVKDFAYGRAVVEQKSKFGMIDLSGKTVIAPKYIQLGSLFCNRGLAVIATHYIPYGTHEDWLGDRARRLRELAGGAFDESEWAGGASYCKCRD